MAVHVIKTRKQLNEEPPPPPFKNPDGTLTRAGAAKAARELWGELACISMDDDLPRLVWLIGEFDRTVGRGRTWEIALARSSSRKQKFEAWKKQQADRKKETAIEEASTD